MGPETADFLFGLANLAAIVGGVLVVLGTAGIFWIGSIREHFADLRIKMNERATAEAQQKAAESKVANTQLQLDLERERHERLKIEERLKPRRLTPDMKRKITEAIRPFLNTPVYLAVPNNNAEGDVLINEIGAVLIDAGWDREKINGSTVHGAVYPDGVTVAFSEHEKGRPPLLIDALRSAFKDIGLASDVGVARDADTQAGHVKIAVGFKPGRDG